MSCTGLFSCRLLFMTAVCMLLSVTYAEDSDRSRYPAFNVSKDILIAQYDNRKDTDDIHAQAALGCILAHPDGQGVNVYAVQHCYDSNDYLKSSDPLFDEIWGRDGWTDAIHEADKTEDEMVKQHGEGYIFNGNREISLERVYERALQVLLAGGRVWIADGGPSGFTQNWLQALIDRDNGIGAGDTKSRVFLVQHSRANENGTSEEDLAYVKANSNYIKIADGNRDNSTPGYRSLSKDNPDKKHMRSATSSDNPNHYARTLWTLARNAVENSGHKGYYNGWIDNGGVDFSDCVENWWILDLGDAASTLDLFWERYVVNVPSTAGGELTLLDDAFVNVKNGDRNYDGRGLKITKKSKKYIYLKFDASGHSGSQNAILSLHCIDPGRGKINVFVADSNFNEGAITYDNQPGYSDASLGSINQSYAAGSDYFINLSGVPLDGNRVSLVLVIEGSGAQSAYDSSETNEANKPMLELVGGGAG